MKIAIAADHGGFELKQEMINHYAKQGLELVDLGCYSPDAVDYPDVAEAMCAEILSNKVELGILICGSGIGISIAANRHKGIRAALIYNSEVAHLAREHNNANIAVFGGRFMSVDDCIKNFDIFLDARFEGGRHERRVCKLDSD